MNPLIFCWKVKSSFNDLVFQSKKMETLILMTMIAKCSNTCTNNFHLEDGTFLGGW